MTTNKMSQHSLGMIAGMLGAISFGFIPVFSKPAISIDMAPACILTYRFGFASIILFVLLLMQRRQVRIPLNNVPSMAMLAVFYCFSGGLLVVGYKYMSGGVTGVIHFTYPLFVMLILVAFYGERLKISSIMAVIIALCGMYCLGVLGSDASFVEGQDKLAGVLIVLGSGLACASYMVGVNKTRTRFLPSLTMTFWLLLFSTIIFAAISIYDGTLQMIPNVEMLINFIALAVIATVLSNFLLVYSIKRIGSTYASILGALEPSTAVISCAILFGESLSLPIVVGILLIFVAVAIVIFRNKKGENQ
ncbi:MAG: EamA family transporter [Muribaculaceae bacterium]|nr:EamA family transporter [Muribaculaceae bacterium]